MYIPYVIRKALVICITKKHDQYVHALTRELEDEYDLILTHVPIYRKRNRKRQLVGEIDILAKKGEEYHAFEVKCSHRITKARLQLRKIKKNTGLNIVASFFYCGSSSLLVQV